MIHKILTLSVMTLPLVIFGVSSQAGQREEIYDHARVINVTPLFEEVDVATPREECWNEEAWSYDRPDSYTAPLLGGIIGGVLGNQIGHGDGRAVATVAGTLLGGSIGNDIRNRQSHRAVEHVRRCRVVDEYHREERVAGYRVKYRYHGQTFVTRMDHDPGDEIRVRVQVTPVY